MPLDPEPAALQRMERELQIALPPERFQHSLGVARTAERLAGTKGVPQGAARVAGLLHDMARDRPGEWLLAEAHRLGIPVGPLESGYPVLLHGPVAAGQAGEHYGIRDPEVLDAIRYHTTGRAGMGNLARIVYVADLIEPAREYPEVERLRDLAGTDMESAFRECLRHTLVCLLRRGRPLHPDAVACWNSLF